MESGSTDTMSALALAALWQQARALERLRARITGAVDAAPAWVEPDWAGPARRLYDLGLGDLHRLLRAAELTVDDAINETQRAIETLTPRVG